MTLSKRQIAEVLFTPTEDGKARCAICGRAYAPGNGYTNRLSHARTHEGYEDVAEEMFISQEANRGDDANKDSTAASTGTSAAGSADAVKETTAAAPAPSAPRPRGRPPGSKNKTSSSDNGDKTKKRKHDQVANGESNESEPLPKIGITQPAKVQIASLRKELQSFQTAVLAAVQALQTEVKTLNERVDTLQTNVNELRNNNRRAKNRRIVEATTEKADDVPLQRLLRLNKAFGGGISGGQQFQVPEVAVGAEFPSPPFPSTVGDVEAMQRQQIHELAVLMDDDFGIVAGDNLTVCRAKVRRVLTDEL